MIKILAVGKKHEAWVLEGIERYEKRLKAPWNAKWELIPHSRFEGDKARQDESEALLKRLSPADFVILLDERGKSLASPEFAELLQAQFVAAHQVVIVIGGACGVSPTPFERANFTLSLSKMVFPHQLVRLILAEQIYRAQQITAGGSYHHE